MITWNATLKAKYEILIVLIEIARVQCINTATCERTFSMQKYTKTKCGNRMLTKNLESDLRVVSEGSIMSCHDIVNEAIGILKK